MLKLFTDRARHVTCLAAEESQVRRHDFVGSEHLWLAMVREGGGLAVRILQDLGVDIARFAEEVAHSLPPGTQDQPLKRPRFTPGAKRVLELAEEEADALEHELVGTEHLLLGLLRETKGAPGQVLAVRSMDTDEVRKQVQARHLKAKPAHARPVDEGGSGLLLGALERLARLQNELIHSLAKQSATPQEEARLDDIQQQVTSAEKTIAEICQSLGM